MVSAKPSLLAMRYHSTVRCRLYSIVTLCALAAPPTSVLGGSVAGSTAVNVDPEYANLPVSTAELRAYISHANLIVRAKIVAYKPPTFADHIATMEETTVVIETTYTGTIKPGEMLTYECVCHQVEQPPSPADRVGHEVLLFLAYGKKTQTWSPATHQSELYFHPELETQLKRMLARKP